VKVIVITGSTRGIGYGLAEAFLERDCRVVVGGRTSGSTQRAANQLSHAAHEKDQILGQPCDVSDPSQVQVLWDRAVESFGQVDIWINNAGLGNELSDFRELTPESMAKVVETNLLGTMYGSRVALNGMAQQGFGALYNMEGHGSNGRKQAGLTLYGTTKAGLRYLNDCLAEEVEGSPVIVCALSPGMIWTDLVSDQFAGHPEVLEKNKGVLNIIMDRVETVAPWLADQMLANQENGARIRWLNRRKMVSRFITAPFNKREIIE